MKEIYKYLLGLVAVIAIVFGFVQYQLHSTEKAVQNYLLENEGLSAMNIETEPFIANLAGDKNWMVSVKVDDDAKTYSYFLNNKGNVVLESYVENGVVKVVNQVMN
ncbi:flagellar basal body-associated protein FliL [Lysinibacillus composti]|uniref:DUF3139 domain-containing protein n=1 Tax=Lysinibacillus composti TaxID=720633 RepID=A0A3N9USC6_9BACI|nr:hypothetical protein [Lysinibacillus composti]MBM7608495.1 flagellar basal body-associated protein FliL [Lysinibacillus composti]RQW74786.1 hypothetical protein EBB45_09285 [Lysinibacillus composti]